MLKRKISNSEILLPFSDYNKIEGKKENLIKSIVFIIIALTIQGLMFYYSSILEREFLKDFILEYISSEIDIIALLLSFSIAYLTILITSDSENIKRLKSYKTDKRIDAKNISLYQILLIQLTYTIYSEIVLLILLLIHKFASQMLSDLFNVVFFIMNIILLLNIIYIILKNVKNIYLSFWKDDLNK